MFAATLSIPKSLGSKVNSIIEKIMDYIITNKFSNGGYNKIIDALASFDGEKFYMIPDVKNNRK